MYIALRPPWSSGDERVATAPPDASAGSATASAKKSKSKKGGRRRGGGNTVGGGDDGWAEGEGGGDGDAPAEAEPPIVLTAADRAMEWRGDNLGMPPKRIDMEDGRETRSLDDGEIAATIDRRGGAAIDCMVRAATGADLSATVTMKMVVSGDGKVGKLKVHAPRFLFENGLYACARRAAARFDFPATGAATLVTAPFELNR
jgi:hypothetical protein